MFSNKKFFIALYCMLIIGYSSITYARVDVKSYANPVLPSDDLIYFAQICTPRDKVIVHKDAIKSPFILSPKSVNFSPDGKKIYINALEGATTEVYSFPSLQHIASIRHIFQSTESNLFHGQSTIFDYTYHAKIPYGNPNIFFGKPVESVFSHNGKYLWISYYRRNFDLHASSPSALAIIDTDIDQIVRVMPTGPLPKVVAVSPDNSLLAVTHWGDNTIGIIDISGNSPELFHYVKHLVVGKRMNMTNIEGDRDRNCGLCLRGTVFSADGKYLFIGSMGGSGIACFTMPEGKFLGFYTGMGFNPRHLLIDKKGEWLYAGSHRDGTIRRVPMTSLLDYFSESKTQRVNPPYVESLFIGRGVRTIVLSPDEKYLYAAINKTSELVQIDNASFMVKRRIGISPFAVGLGISPDGNYVAVTSQGGYGIPAGNSVEIFHITRLKENIDSSMLGVKLSESNSMSVQNLYAIFGVQNNDICECVQQ